MPRKAIDYQKVIIYKLVCNDLTVKDLYVGHTTDFTNRKKSHKDRCIHPNNPRYNLKVYQIMRENGSWVNWSMIEIEKYPCNDDNEARARERHWYEVLDANLNTISPKISFEEKKQYNKNYRDKNKDKYQEYNKDYYVQNKDKLLEKMNEKHKCICGGCFTTKHKSNHLKTKKHIHYLKDNNLNDNIQ